MNLSPSTAQPGRALGLGLGVVLGFVAGFADASTFVGAEGVFCAHVTGNFVVLAADFARGAGADEWLKLASFPIFVFTVLAVTCLVRRLRAQPPAVTRQLLVLQGVLLLAASAVGLECNGAKQPGAARASCVALMVMAMAIQNASHRIDPTLGPMTTVMTGNVTQLLADMFAPRSDDVHARRRRIGGVTAGFAIGCAIGAFGVSQFGFTSAVVAASATFATQGLLSGIRRAGGA